MRRTKCLLWTVVLILTFTFISCVYFTLSWDNTSENRINSKFRRWKFATKTTMMKSSKDDESQFVDFDKKLSQTETHLPVATNSRAHIFYYPWYGNPKFDGQYYHWNHELLPHWDREIAKKWPRGKHHPPMDIASNYYPQLGTYSSTDPQVIEKHMKWMKETGVGVVVVSWYPRGLADSHGHSWDELIPSLLSECSKVGLRLTFHLEPYRDRTVETVKDDIRYLIETYGQHDSFYRLSKNGRNLPLFYVYDSYLIDGVSWHSLLDIRGPISIRNTPLDAHILGLLVHTEHRRHLLASGFDGFYTYFAADRFSFGSTADNWSELAKFARENGLLFAPSVGPGYDDRPVRPWNGSNRRGRTQGMYYQRRFRVLLDCLPDLVTITSFNEWHEGTQIEPAVPKITHRFTYDTYDQGPNQYLILTKKMLASFPR